MCFSSPKTQTPATPPPAPPVLDQAAPDTATPSQSAQLAKRAQGTKQYRSTLAIGTPTASANQSTGIGLTM